MIFTENNRWLMHQSFLHYYQNLNTIVNYIGRHLKGVSLRYKSSFSFKIFFLNWNVSISFWDFVKKPNIYFLQQLIVYNFCCNFYFSKMRLLTHVSNCDSALNYPSNIFHFIDISLTFL